MTNKTRSNWLTDLLGKEKAEEVITDTLAATETLAEAGIMPKSIKAFPEDEEKKPEGEAPPAPAPEGEKEPPAPEPDKEPVAPPPEEDKAGNMVDEVGVKLAQQIFDAAQGNLATLTQEQLGKVISDALRPAVEEEAPVAEPEAAPAAPPPPEREEDESVKSLGNQVSETTEKALGELIVQMAKDQGEMARGYQEMVDKVAAEKALAPVVQELVKAVEEIKAQLGDRPRIASQATETLIDETTEAGKAIKEAAEKGVNREKTFMGVKVKDIPK